MKIDEILELIFGLSFSQGFYGRLYRDLMETKDCDPKQWKKIVNELEGQNFQSDLDVILYFEC